MNNMTGVVIALVHALLPFMTLMLVTVMQAIRREVEEAAQTLGASALARVSGRWCFRSRAAGSRQAAP